MAKCSICGRTLRSAESIAAGVGPSCAAKTHKNGHQQARDHLQPDIVEESRKPAVTPKAVLRFYTVETYRITVQNYNSWSDLMNAYSGNAITDPIQRAIVGRTILVGQQARIHAVEDMAGKPFAQVLARTIDEIRMRVAA